MDSLKQRKQQLEEKAEHDKLHLTRIERAELTELERGIEQLKKEWRKGHHAKSQEKRP